MKNVLLLLSNGFETYEASVFIDVLGWNLVDGDRSTKLKTCGITKEVATTFGQRVIVDHTVDEINIAEFDALAIPGGFEEYGFYNDAYSNEFKEMIIEFNNQKKIIASICVAALCIGNTGILKNRKATTYNGLDEKRQAQLKAQGAILVNQPIVEDGNIITSWNPSTAIPVALLLLEKLTNKENSNNVKRIMGF